MPSRPAVVSARLEVTIADPVADGVPAVWDDTAGAWGLPVWWRSALLVDAAWNSNVPVWLAVVADAGGSVHGLFVVRHLGPAGHGRFAAGRRPPLVGIAEVKLVPMGAQSGIALAPGLGADDTAAAVRALERALRRRLGPRLTGVAYRHVDAGVVEALRLAGHARTLSSTADMTLANPGTGRAGYLATLPPKWRSQLKKIHARISAGADANGRAVTASVDDAVGGAEASVVIDVVRRRHHEWFLVRPPIAASYLDLLGELPGTRFVTYRDDRGRLLALSTVHEEGDGLALTWWGSSGESRDLYFDQFLRLAHLMIDEDRAFLRMGKGMNDIKARYGARPQPQWTVVGAL